LNLNPSIAWQVTDKLSIGAGANAMYMKAKLSQAIDFGTILVAAGDTPQRDDGKVDLDADDWGFGYNVGLLYQFSDATRLGLSYRSQVKQHLKGDADFSVPATAQSILAGLGSGAFQNSGASADVTLPDMASMSLFHRLSPMLAVMADISWTHWSTLDELRIKFDNPEQPESITTLKWEDAWRFGLGATYTPVPVWDIRIGAMYDQTPIPDAEHRTPRLPDQDRLWTTIGTSYRFTDALSADLAYAHLFMLGDANVDMEPVGENLTRGGLKGSYDNTGNIVSAQVNYTW
jgi:long-chain fatty acid transport protein